MDIVDQLIKQAQKELQKIQIQALGIASSYVSKRHRTETHQSAKKELDSSNKSLSKNSVDLKSAIEGQFSKKLTETFEKQQQMLDSIKN